jgi:Icc-related predicted phosphoesterase
MGILRRKGWNGSADAEPTHDLYYASDVHGSDICWRKFLGAGRYYGVPTLIMGGDLTGKVIVPVERRADGSHVATFLGEDRTASDADELDKLTAAIRYNGMYPWITTPEEIAGMREDDDARSRLFDRLIVEGLRAWIALGDDRAEAYGLDIFVMPGNDDPWACDDVLEAATRVQSTDDRTVRVGEHEMISCAYANHTPWNSPRELDESALYDRINRLASQLERPETAIFNLHVPPYDSGLDTAREIDENLKIVLRNSQPHEIPVGSTAVRELIEEYQPMLSLHGHIHESKGEARIGRTLALNSGSEYNSGRIHGVVVKLGADSVRSHQFVLG